MISLFIFILQLLLFATLIPFCTPYRKQSLFTTLIPNKPSYLVNERVSILCNASLAPGIYSFFKHHESMRGDNCKVYKPRFGSKCFNRTDNDGTTWLIQEFIIKKLKWSDRGNWSCQAGQKISVVTINVKVPSIVKRIGVKFIRPKQKSIKKMIGETSDTDADSDRINYAGVGMMKPPLEVARGTGSRTNPYNLRDGSSVNVTCMSSCSFPVVSHQWMITNTTFKHNVTSKRTLKENICSDFIGLYSSISYLIINCSTFALIGANDVTCQADTSFKRIYVLCQGGNKPWMLTTGEIVGLITSAIILCLLIFLLSALIRHNTQQSRLAEMDGAQQKQQLLPSISQQPLTTALGGGSTVLSVPPGSGYGLAVGSMSAPGMLSVQPNVPCSSSGVRV